MLDHNLSDWKYRDDVFNQGYPSIQASIPD